jgi:hypothetical protein
MAAKRHKILSGSGYRSIAPIGAREAQFAAPAFFALFCGQSSGLLMLDFQG